jgi:hypothetical protein
VLVEEGDVGGEGEGGRGGGGAGDGKAEVDCLALDLLIFLL